MSDRMMFTEAERTLLLALNEAFRAGTIRHPIRAQFTARAGETEVWLDFAIPAVRLGVQIDGELFHSTAESRKRDMEQDKALAADGWRVVRFTDGRSWQTSRPWSRPSSGSRTRRRSRA